MGLFSGLAKIALSPIRGVAEAIDDISGKNEDVDQCMSAMTLGASSLLKGTAKGIKKGSEDIFEG